VGSEWLWKAVALYIATEECVIARFETQQARLQ
jgi:hypothetical protein